VTNAFLPPGTLLGKYLLVRAIGSGGMGAVYEATHLELRKRVAIKTLLPSLAVNPEARARFLREGEAASRIEHPNVVNVTDIGVGGDVPFLVMEFLDGENLAQRLAREGGLSMAGLLDLLLPIMDALARGHDEGVVHRDLKPHNIFLSRGGDGRLIPKLLDYGVSKIVDDDRGSALTGSLAVLGTAQYMAPEQIDGPKNVDARTDQYAMGLVLFECATGHAARQGSSPLAMLKSVASEQVPSLRQVRPDIDAGFDAVVARALSFHPGGRFPSMRALMGALLPFARVQTRAHWQEALTGRVDSEATTSPPMPRTLVLPDSAPGALAPSTTFRNATGEVATVRTPPRGRFWAVAFVAVALLAGGAYALVEGLSGRSSGRGAQRVPVVTETVTGETPRPRPPQRRPVEIRTAPPEATLRIDGFAVGRSPLSTDVSAGPHELMVSAPGFRPATLEFGDDRPLPALIELAPEAAAVKEPRPTPRPRPKTVEHRHKATPEPPPADEPTRRGVNDSVILQ
jgi:serine/threonine-protein kinase